MPLRYLLIVGVFLSIPLGSHAQSKALKKLSTFVESGRYVEGIAYADSIESDKKIFYYLRGKCHFHLRNLEDALENFSQAYSLGYDDEELLWHLGLTHHLNYEFAEAAQAYKLYLSKLKDDDPRQSEIIKRIKQCGYALKAINWEQNGFVENLGAGVNSPYNDYGPVFSPNYKSKFYFTSNRSNSTGGLRDEEGLKNEKSGSYSSDIYAVEMQEGEWTAGAGIPPFLNSPFNETLLDFSSDGSILFFKRHGGGRNASFMADTFSTKLPENNSKLYLPAVSHLGDEDLFWVNDSTFIFSSCREGGYGGYDLYMTEQKDGIWSIPQNLGPEINSIYNERSPFLANSGTLLYYSSDRENSIGGYDIYYATFGVEKSGWNSGNNMGYPISSPGDDLFFRLDKDGRSALFSSDRKNSLGGDDIFVVYLKDQVIEQSAYSSFNPFEGEIIETEAMVEAKRNSLYSEKTETSLEVKSREIVLSPLYFSESKNVASESNLQDLTNLADIMNIFPGTRVTLASYTEEENNKAYELYFSIKRAEEAADFLLKQGISGQRIYLLGFGAQYPLVKDKRSSLAKRNNQRVDIQITNDNPALIVNYKNPVVADILRDNRSKVFEEINQKAVFRLHVKDTRQLLNNPDIIGQEHVMVYKKGGENPYSYLVGMTNDYSAILNLKIKFLEKGYKNMEVMVFIEGMAKSKDEIPRFLERYPNLQEYVQYEID
jgi:outer membrane protein OmpA-like peptidoglycan-associated protein/tetratricopeptide (TPR) repeat protein